MHNKITLLLGVVVCLVSVLIYNGFHSSGSSISISEFINVTASVVAIIGAISTDKKNKKIKQRRENVANFQLTTTVESGLYGGLIGGTFGGIVIAVIYYQSIVHNPYYHNVLTESLKCIPYCSFVGATIGGVTQIFIRLFIHLSQPNKYLSLFLGCFFGSMISAICTAVLGMWLFGDNGLPFVGTPLITFGGVVTAISIVMGSLIYEYEGQIRYVFFSLIISFIFSLFAVMIGSLFFNRISAYINDMVYSNDLKKYLEVGVVIGCICGIILGLTIGFTMVSYKYWRFAEKQERKLIPLGN